MRRKAILGILACPLLLYMLLMSPVSATSLAHGGGYDMSIAVDSSFSEWVWVKNTNDDKVLSITWELISSNMSGLVLTPAGDSILEPGDVMRCHVDWEPTSTGYYEAEFIARAEVIEPEGVMTQVNAGFRLKLNVIDLDVAAQPTEVNEGEQITFSYDLVDVKGDISSVEWSGHADVTGPDSYVLEPGTHTITASAHDRYGTKVLSDSVTVTVNEASNEAPKVTANASPDTKGDIGETFTLSADATDSDGTIASYEWQKDGEVVSTEKAFNFTPETNGLHEFTVTATDDKDATATDTVTLDINAPPTVSIQADPGLTVMEGEAITFSANYSDSDGEVVQVGLPGGGLAYVRWTGIESAGTYILEPGEHTITATVKDDDGADATDTVTVTVNEDPNETVTRQLHNGWNAFCFPFDVDMAALADNFTGDIDGYLYWFDDSAQRYKYYNIVELTGEPEYASEFETLPAGENLWVWLHGDSGSVEYENVPQGVSETYTEGWNVVGCAEERPMSDLVSELDNNGVDYDGYIYWFDAELQTYKYYNVVSKTNEPEYESQFDTMMPGQTYWVYCYS